jgi:hypothetical protein
MERSICCLYEWSDEMHDQKSFAHGTVRWLETQGSPASGACEYTSSTVLCGAASSVEENTDALSFVVRLDSPERRKTFECVFLYVYDGNEQLYGSRNLSKLATGVGIFQIPSIVSWGHRQEDDRDFHAEQPSRWVLSSILPASQFVGISGRICLSHHLPILREPAHKSAPVRDH